MPTLNFNLSKIKCKTWSHFLTLMNNDKTFSSLDGMACSYQWCSDQFWFLPGHSDKPRYWISWDLKKTQSIYLKTILITSGIIWSLKLKKKEWRNCGITNTNIFRKKSFLWVDKNFFGQKNYGDVVLNWRNYDQIMPMFGRSFIINDKCIFQ